MSTQPAPEGGVVQQTVPWSKTASWVVVLIESLFLIAAGIYILVDPQVSAQTIAWVLGIYFLVSSAMRVFVGLRNAEPSEATKLSMLRGGVGLTVGVLASLQPWVHTLDVAAALVIVGVGLLLYGLIGIYTAIATRVKGFPWAALVAALLNIVLAAFIFLGMTQPTVALKLIGYLTIFAGLLLLVFAFILHRRAKAAAAAAAAAPPPPAAPALSTAPAAAPPPQPVAAPPPPPKPVAPPPPAAPPPPGGENK